LAILGTGAADDHPECHGEDSDAGAEVVGWIAHDVTSFVFDVPGQENARNSISGYSCFLTFASTSVSEWTCKWSKKFGIPTYLGSKKFREDLSLDLKNQVAR
jgi:hypothetical protein